MTTQAQEESKLQALITKFGGWAGIALVSLACWTYQGDRSKTNDDIRRLEEAQAVYAQQVNRLEDTKLSKAEFKMSQDVWIRETTGMREDVRELTKAMHQLMQK